MNTEIAQRTLTEANLILTTNKTLRQLAEDLQISKSTIHKDMNKTLKHLDLELYQKVKTVFQEHIKTRHLKGGASTKKKSEMKS